MSRATRPLRRVRGVDRERLAGAVLAYCLPVPVWPERGREPLLQAWRCRPAQLRRCLLGLPVSARAAAKILAAASRPSTGPGPGR